jgi:hypothetical protein
MNPDNKQAHISRDLSRAVAIATRLGFEIYGGCALLFAFVMLIFWRPTSRDFRNLESTREKQRLAVCVGTGAVSRVLHVVALGFVTSVTYVGLHHALPMVWIVAHRSLFRARPSAFPDLIACGLMCTAFAVLLAGDMLQRTPGWLLDRRAVALPLVVVSSLFRGAQRNFTKTLKAHFSFRLMLLATMIADALVMLVAALAADYQVVPRIFTMGSGEALSAGVAIVAMTVAVICDVAVARFYDLVSNLALTAITLPAAAALFAAFELTTPAATYVTAAAILAAVAVITALGSGEVNRRTKNLLLGAEEEHQA